VQKIATGVYRDFGTNRTMSFCDKVTA